ncbi:hypothetical protein HYH03_007981 [Edaphochlamys debaryana]|uniref:GCK domain-containing protein n=1 Tax=Edaphochlamys debaryana TaxID=47281 RepID=A0A835YA42_9CHLO|nr:hypothetical protein HYH03_007981 [Edaphochlamys debaryana]|eukprot:KAG2493759.1 hypothetical protein HYH03_007981 [Edaphochlamys debaryana]
MTSAEEERAKAQANADAKPTAEPAAAAGKDEEEEDEEECGWCKWMKAGGCKEPFQVWLDCVDAVKAEGREDVESCSAIMGPLWECMERNKEYYAPQLSSLADKKRSKEEGEEGAAEGEGQGGQGGQEGAAGSGEGQAAAPAAAGGK